MAPQETVDDQHRHIAAAVEKALHAHLADHLTQVERTVVSCVEAVTVGRRQVDRVVREHTPAWLRKTEGEPRWPVMLAVLAAVVLQLAIPHRLALRPYWLLPALEIALMVVLTVANPRRINVEHSWLRAAGLTLVALATFANVYSAARLVWLLANGKEPASAPLLLLMGLAVWFTNVIVFALWYWEFDRGGPAARAHARKVYPDFQFPQMQTPDATHPDWEPTFVDYLYLSFTNATAFSPTDTLPMTRWAKMTMMTQSGVSLITVALVIARAVNILK